MKRAPTSFVYGHLESAFVSSKTQISEPLAPEQRFSSRAMYRTPSEMEKTDLDGSLMYSKSTMYNLHSSFFKALKKLRKPLGC